MAKPTFKALWDAYPDKKTYPNLEALFTHLGGTVARNIHVNGFGPNGNTCAARMSVALNGAGSRIIGGKGINTIGAADGTRIIFRVSELRIYLERLLGKAEKDDSLPFDSDFGGRKGIVAFTVKGWGGPTGHVALFDGAKFREKDDDYSRYREFRDNKEMATTLGEFWELK